MTDKRFTSHNACLVACLSDNDVRESVAAMAAAAFKTSMMAILTERQLVGVDFVNTYYFFEEGRSLGENPAAERDRPCASHDYCDPNHLMASAMLGAVSGHMAAGDPIPHPLFDPDMDMLEHIAAGDEVGIGASLAWREAWRKAADAGFSRLWEVKGDVLAEAAFQTLAELVMARPAGAAAERYPECPVYSDDPDILDSAVDRFVAGVVYDADTAVEVSTIVLGLVDENDAAGLVEYLGGFDVQAVPPRPRM